MVIKCAPQVSLLTTLFLFVLVIVDAQTPIPHKYDGFLYKSLSGGDPGLTTTILVEAFLDPVCPDSRDSWPPLKQAIDYYSARVALILHPFPLPYHEHAFSACRALHIADAINSSSTFSLLEKFFETQGMFYNKPTYNKSKSSVLSSMVTMMSSVTGTSAVPTINSGFEDTKTDHKTRISFKYGCSRGVYGAPFFFVNGFLIPGAGSPVNYKTWRSILDPLFGEDN